MLFLLVTMMMMFIVISIMVIMMISKQTKFILDDHFSRKQTESVFFLWNNQPDLHSFIEMQLVFDSDGAAPAAPVCECQRADLGGVSQKWTCVVKFNPTSLESLSSRCMSSSIILIDG